MLTLEPVSADNWRDIADLSPRDDQRRFVAPLAARYLLLPVYGDTWHCLGAFEEDTAVAHVMWGIDDDGSCWIGGLLVDQAHQGRGLGRQVMGLLIAQLRSEGRGPIRLSHSPGNAAAVALFTSLGFRPTGAREDDEIVLELVGADRGARWQ